MAYRLKRLPLAVFQLMASGALVTLAASPAMAQQASSSDTAQVQRVEITGSNIKRSDKETSDNVQVVTAAQIKQSGQTTVADFMRTLSSNFASFTEQDTNSFSPGSSAITLRGLNPKYTLVLLNGQRITNYGFAQNLEETFVDLNIIPINAIDHIDVVKDGASAIYGSDAVAGVVNIVLKSNYQAKEVDAQYGAANGNSSQTYQSSITAGFGNLQDDGFNLMVAADVFHRQDLLASQRPLTAAQDTSQYPGGSFGWTNGNYYTTTANPGVAQALPTCGQNGYPGQIINANSYQTGGLTGTTCSYNTASQTSLIPGTDRANIVLNGTLKINSSITAFGDVFLSAVKTKALLGYPSFINGNSVVYNGATGAVSPVSNILPAGNSSNILGAAPVDGSGNPTAAGTENGSQALLYSFQSVGNQYYQVNSYTSRVVGGLKGSINPEWDWQVVGGISENNVGSTNFNAINVPALQSAIANNTYNFLNPNLTPAATNALRAQFEQASVSKLETLEAKVSGSLFSLPAGEVQAAFGYQYRHESEDNQPDSKLLAGDILNYGATEVNGSRSVNAIYGELEIPILKSLTSNIALREEKYNDFGSNTSPKIGFRYQPLDILTLRAAYSLGFEAPSLPEISHSSATYFSTVTDPLDPQGRPSESIAGVNVANPKLKAEKSKNVDLGFVLAPTKDLSFATDFYRISLDNLIAGEGTPQNVVSAYAAGTQSQFPGAQVVRNSAGTIEYVSVPYANLYRLYTRGVDFDGSYIFHLSPGSKLTSDLNFTYVDHMDVNTTPGGKLQNFAGTDGWLWFSPIAGGGPVPHVHGSFSETWDNHDWTVRGTTNFTSGYKEEYCIQYAQYGTCGTGAGGASANVLASNVHSYTSFDLYSEYRGFKNWTLSASVTNLFNRTPPFDAGENGIETAMYSLIGRFANVRAAYKF